MAIYAGYLSISRDHFSVNRHRDIRLFEENVLKVIEPVTNKT